MEEKGNKRTYRWRQERENRLGWMDKCLLFCLQGAPSPEWNRAREESYEFLSLEDVIFPISLCWMERNRCCWAIQVKCTVTSIPSRRCSAAGWFMALPGRIPQEWHSWWLRQCERFSMGFRGQPSLSKASDLYTGTMCVSRSFIFVQKPHFCEGTAESSPPPQLQNRLDKWEETKQGHDSEVLKAPYLLQRNPLVCIDLMCLGISRHAASSQLLSILSPFASRGGTGAGTGRCGVGWIMTLTAFTGTFLFVRPEQQFPMQSPRMLGEFTMAIDKQVAENLTQHWKLFPSVPSLPESLSSQSLQCQKR